ncbi:MAG TPA: tRNA glutamyl-Q(34) synthetase GluQRS [Candidatus Saccharimonadales bacterium]|nr:tRNA glutamyl-Q(34) synthetase GluQRS [Candidatus Saccharimonadales bacterium]
MAEEHSSNYRGRLAPSPTGYLHLGHARTFWTAQERARAQGGVLLLRNENLDRDRCKPEFVTAMLEDLRWFGFDWQEGPDVVGPYGPYSQSERMDFYRDALQRLREGGFVYPCTCSRRDVQRALNAPHASDDEPIYPGTCRNKVDEAVGANWRFRVPEGEEIAFTDGCMGKQTFTAGTHFGDFVVWRQDQVPAYQLAVVADDAGMKITEVVRGADLLVSTARQLLLYRALELVAPSFFHCPLVVDENGVRLAKRNDALSLRTLRERGQNPEELRKAWDVC